MSTRSFVCRILAAVSGVHILLLYLYQAQWVQENIPQYSVAPRCVCQYLSSVYINIFNNFPNQSGIHAMLPCLFFLFFITDIVLARYYENLM